MDLRSDPRIVLTLDAGGTKLEFNAVQGGRALLDPLRLPSMASDLAACLGQLGKGFESVFESTGRKAVALSFAFPGPADYPRGIIGDLPNLPAFRGGVALGPMLEDRFGLPVFINNDGDLFAYGEAIGGLLPWVNEKLAAAGSPKRYRNLFGFTFGTGFGGGVVHGGELLLGDNSAAGEVWCLRSGDSFAEDGVSIRGLRRAFAELAGMPHGAAPEPREIEAIALGRAPGDAQAARRAFERLGEVAGDAIANALALIDGLVVIGGGLSKAWPLFMPSLLRELNGSYGGGVDRLELKAFNLEDPESLAAFVRGEAREVQVPGSARTVPYDPLKRTGVGLSRLGTGGAVALGAYAFALQRLDSAVP